MLSHTVMRALATNCYKLSERLLKHYRHGLSPPWQEDDGDGKEAYQQRPIDPINPQA
jgi:hypothetical protein